MEGEALVVRESGRPELWIKYRTRRILIEGRITVAMAIDDITERKRTENALSQSERKFRSLFENSFDAIFLTNADGSIEAVNPAACSMLGWSEQELCAKGFADIYEIDDPKQSNPLIKQHPDGRIRVRELTVIHKNGEKFPVEFDSVRVPVEQARFFIIMRNITNRKLSEKALSESEEKFRNIFHLNAIPLSISTVKESRFIDVNEAFTKLTGYKRQEVIGRTAQEIAVWANWEDRIRLATLMDSEGRVDNAEVKVRTKTGEIRTSLISAVFVDVAGQSCFLGSMNDITERKKAEQALHESEDRYRSLFNTNHAVMLLVEPCNGKIIEANPAACAYYGYTLEEIKELEITDINIQPPELVRSAMQQARLEQCRHFFFKHRLADGHVRDVEVFSGPISFNGRKLLYSIVHDITERKQAEEALRESEERFHKAFMSSPAPLVISDIATGLFIDANEQWVRMLGYTREEQVGRTSKEVGIWADPGERDRLVKKLVDQGHFKDEPIEYKSKSGQRIFALWSAESVSLSGHQVMLSLFFDETERRGSEKEKEKLQKQLLQAHKMETVGRLAGGVAHDYNNMLSVIVGYSEMAMEKVPPNDPIHADLSEILTAAKRSTEITRQLLAFARKQTIAPRVLDLNETVENMLKMLRRLIGEDIDLAWRPGGKLWLVKIDPAQVDQILVNLCVNARDAIAGIGRITIETGNVSFDEANCNVHEGFSPGEFILLSVSDNGCGMNEMTLGNLFEPFFTTKGVGRGTGLGLSTVYGIVKQNKGFINVCSELGKGATFKIYLPRHTDKSLQKRAASQINTPTSCGETVLLVEDEPAIMRMAQKMLQKLGYHVLAAGTPSQALDVAKELAGGIDLLITDVIMPEMNGRELSNLLGILHPGLKTLFMSGYTADVIAHHGVLEKGMYFIQKPFSVDELGVKVKTLLDQE